MALEYKAGTFSVGALGNLSITGVGFQPKAVLFFTGVDTTSLPLGKWEHGMGFMDDSGNQAAVSTMSENIEPSDTGSYTSSTKCLVGLGRPVPITTLLEASYVSMDADGFTINIAKHSGNAVNYVAFGGDILARVGTATITTGAGPDSISTGINPNVLHFISAAPGTTFDTVVSDLQFSFGVATSTAQYSNSVFKEDNQTAQTNRGGVDSETYAIAQHQVDGTAIVEGDVSLGSGGFTVTKNTVPGSTTHVHYLALEGVTPYLGKFLADEGVGGTKAITGVGFTPIALSFFSNYRAGTGLSRGLNSFHYGVSEGYDPPTNGVAYAQSNFGWDNPGSTEDDGVLRSNSAFSAYFYDTRHEEFDVDTLDVDGFTIRNRGAHLYDEDVFFLALDEGVIGEGCVRGEKCTSSFGIIFDEYGVCGTSSVPELGSIGWNCAKLSGTATTSQYVEYDLGASYTDFEIADVVVIQGLRAFLNIDDPITVRVRASDDPAFGTFDEDTSSVALSDLIGTFQDTWVKRFTLTTKRRYWRVIIETTTAQNPTLEAVALCKEIRFERSPAAPTRFRLLDRPSEARKNAWEIDLNFEGVVELHKEDLDRRLLSIADVTPIWLYDANNAALFGKEVMRVFMSKATQIESRGIGQLFNLSFTFEEVV